MVDSTLEEVRRRIAGPESLLLIKAPAGYGKTHEAVEAATTIAPTLPPGRKVLFLTHTNGARETFNRRLRGGAAEMKTIHSLAAEIVDAYSAPLGLPRPLQPHLGEPSFTDMVILATEILIRRDGVARGLALRHPVILVDEYQDCDENQHFLIELIATAAPTRRRLFGDDLQGIFDWEGNPVDFAAMAAANPAVELTTPWRWAGNKEMQEFIVEARRAMEGGEPLDLTAAPSCITVQSWSGQAPDPHQEGHVPDCLNGLRACLGGNAVVLTHHNAHALGLRKKLPGHGYYYEGTDHEPARILLDKVIEADGNPQTLVALLVEAMDKWGQGMTKPYRDQISEICTSSGVELGRKRKVEPFSRLCARLYAHPTAREWLDCLRWVLDGEHGIDGWRILRGDQIRLLARLHPDPEDDPSALLHAEARARDAIRPAPGKGFMTIHKAKGLEFDEVAIPYCAGSLFQDDIESRRRMYVAVSRAQHGVHFLASEDDPTPLLRV
jgi:hypothetical protein